MGTSVPGQDRWEIPVFDAVLMRPRVVVVEAVQTRVSTWGAVAFVFALVATVGFLDWMAVLLVRAEERWKQAEEAERRAARRAGDRAAGEG